METNNKFLDFLPRVLWVVHVAIIIIMDQLYFKEKLILQNDPLIISLSLCLILFGSFLVIWSGSYVGKFQNKLTAMKVIIEGPFRIVRHPMYVGMYLILPGFWLLLGLSAILIVSICFIPVWIIDCYFEEKRMIELFSEEYQQYQSKVGMFFPKI